MDERKGSSRLKPAGIIFDFDGTLVNLNLDWDLIRSNLQNYLRSNYDIDITMRPIVPKIYEALDMIRKQGKNEHKLKEIKKDLYDIIAIEEWKKKDKMSVVENNVSQILKRLNNYLKVGVVSNNGKKIVSEAWKRFKFPEISGRICREDVIYMKPKADGVNILLNMWGLEGKNVFVLGDSDYDIELAQLIGAKGIWLKTNPSKKLNWTKPNYIIESLKEVEDIIL